MTIKTSVDYVDAAVVVYLFASVIYLSIVVLPFLYINIVCRTLKCDGDAKVRFLHTLKSDGMRKYRRKKRRWIMMLTVVYTNEKYTCWKIYFINNCPVHD